MLSRAFKSRALSNSGAKDCKKSISFLAREIQSRFGEKEKLQDSSAFPEFIQKCPLFSDTTFTLPVNKHVSSSFPQLLHRKYSSESLPPHIVFKMPSLSPTMTEGNLVEWKKKEGDEITSGDVICVIETDKATLENESQEDGFLAKILVQAGTQNIPVNQPIAIIAESQEDVEKLSKIGFNKDLGGDNISQKEDTFSQEKEPSTGNIFSEEFLAARIAPSARKLLIENKIDFSEIIPTGPKGIITKEDLVNEIKKIEKTKEIENLIREQAKAESTEATSAPPVKKTSEDLGGKGKILEKKIEDTTKQVFVDVPTSHIRKIIATRLLHSKFDSPHCYFKKEINIDKALKLRKDLSKKSGVPISLNDIVMKAVANSLNQIKEANVFWNEEKECLSHYESVDINFAVTTEKGLFTPKIKNANLKSVSEINDEAKVLAENARNGTLKPEEFQPGSFGVSNLGTYSIDNFIAIVNPPQGGILAFGKREDVIEWHENDDGSKIPVAVSKLVATLSTDVRAIDGEVAGKLLCTIAQNLENPNCLLL